MKLHIFSLALQTFFCIAILGSLPQVQAADSSRTVQERYSSPSKRQSASQLSGRRTSPTKKVPTTDQKFSTVFAKLSKLKRKVTSLESQVAAQAQYISKFEQIITLHSSGNATIQASRDLNLQAAGKFKVKSSLVDIQSPLSGIHGVLKADTVITKTMTAQSYTPEVGNIW